MISSVANTAWTHDLRNRTGLCHVDPVLKHLGWWRRAHCCGWPNCLGLFKHSRCVDTNRHAHTSEWLSRAEQSLKHNDVTEVDQLQGYITGMSDTFKPLFGPDALLVVACSKRKRTHPGVLPAIERYDGPVFRLLRRFLTQHPSISSRIYVLSAEFGLVPCSHPIPVYDRRMTRTRAHELQPMVMKDLQGALLCGLHYDLFVCVGHDYMPALVECNTALSSAGRVYVAGGSVGRRLSLLHDWLYGHPPAAPPAQHHQRPSDCPRIRGVDVPLTADQVLDIARQSIGDNEAAAQNYQSWYVVVDDQHIAPKWLVSQACGLPVSSFSTDDARRLLAHLGIPVSRV